MNKPIQPNHERAQGEPRDHTYRIHKILDVLDQNLADSTAVHQALLENQQAALNAVFQGLAKRNQPLQSIPEKKAVFSNAQLREFSIGSIAKCFGQDFAVLDTRQSPRIPNGGLLMIDTITKISGERFNLSPPASITSEYYVQPDAWFLHENLYPSTPLSILMELALQPCGILSAYLGTALILPPENNRFRNLDGHIHFTGSPNLSGRTVVNHAALQDAFTSGGMHIQKYSFALSVDGEKFLDGESTFGYFTAESMANQAGLGKTQLLMQGTDQISTRNMQQSVHFNLSDSIVHPTTSADSSISVILGEKNLSTDEWFYANHFFQDPVMPGSLGAEAVMGGLWEYLLSRRDLSQYKNPVLDFITPEKPFIWKYRGQVIPKNIKITYQANITNEKVSGTETTINADADFWVDNLHIYAFKNLALSIREG